MSDEDDCPPLCEMDTADSNGEDDEWEVAEEQNEPVKCLFCDSISPTMTVAIRHAKQQHDFDLAGVRRRYHLDEYSYIKMINYIRREKPSAEQFKVAHTGSSLPWADDRYLKPVENETWLMFDLDELDEIMLNNGGSNGGNGSLGEKENGTDIGETMTLTTDQYRKLQGIINDLTAQLREKENLLQHAASSMEKMKQSFRNVMEEPTPSKEKVKGVGGDQKLQQIKKKLEHCVSSVSVDDDQGYFNTYSHFGIHHDMLSDEVRTSSYRDAILRNADIIKDKVVLDLGCGTAILSMFASKAGAKEVISVDQSDIIYQAMDIVRSNNIDNIRFVKGRLEDTELPVEKVDIIVSEWMGYFLLFEGMMDSVIYARKQYLRDGGLILPNRCNISIAGYGDLERHNEFIGFWKNVYGFDMSCMKKEVLREATVEECKPEHVITNANIIANFDLMEVDVDCPNFSYEFTLSVKRDSHLTALVGYFDTFFELPEHIEFSTSPYTRPTHWKQTIFYLEEPVPVSEGQSIVGKFICRRDPKDQLLDEYPKCFIVGADNVGSRQMQTIRMSLRGTAIVLMGKNTMMRKAIRGHLENNQNLEKLLNHIKGNVGFVFTKGDLAEVRDKLTESKVRAPARAGAIAPLHVVIPAQNTGLGPEKTSFFQALSIPTKISKGTIEIINDVPILKPGDKVGASEATLLNMLNISPFSYGLQIQQVYDSGSIFSPDILDIKPEDLRAKFQAGVANLAAVSLQIGYPTLASVPHSIANGFRNLLAIAAVTEVEFKEAETVKEFIKDPSKFAAVSAAAAPAAAAAAPAAKVEEKKEESESEDDDMGFGLFD
ncbi:hypothetical protein ZHAS_00004637 [Anopheles sinensis]|uniref:Large ribosomal subunit protein uL10 n=1 Tax=Anopheles sinensis TaxID=74873 RepID=A0A084VHA0_ANOSI|nr:hypothetical protein ZHAS_00004637 [Anopheles sinensis]